MAAPGPPLFVNCLPEAMPSWMLVTHNAMEILFTPGRVTMLGESDGNRLRRIYTDGRSHPDVPDPTFHGHSIGHWEGDTLVVETTNFRDEGIYRNANPATLRLIERFTRVDADTISYEFTIDNPTAFTKPWTAQLPLQAINSPVYEYACHEGNYGMTGALKGARVEEKKAAEAAKDGCPISQALKGNVDLSVKASLQT